LGLFIEFCAWLTTREKLRVAVLNENPEVRAQRIGNSTKTHRTPRLRRVHSSRAFEQHQDPIKRLKWEEANKLVQANITLEERIARATKGHTGRVRKKLLGLLTNRLLSLHSR
jgi:hypothetical protein